MLQFDIWDTAGQERFDCLGVIYYKTSKGALIVYDITKRVSFEKAKYWINELFMNAEANIKILLMGNKSDMEEEREVSREEGENMAKEYNVLFAEVSAKSGEGVKRAFLDLMMSIKEADFRTDTEGSVRELTESSVRFKRQDDQATGRCC